MARGSLVLTIVVVASACGGQPRQEPTAGAASPTAEPTPESPSPSPTPKTVSDAELASADLVLVTGETSENLELGGFALDGEEILSPSRTISVPAGDELTLVLQNIHGYLDDENIAHNFTVVAEKDESAEPLWGAQTETISPGESDLITFTPEEPGRYFFICSLAGHMDPHGMWGRFVVVET